MKFQDSSFKGLKVTVGTKSVTHPRTHAPTHAPKAICPINFFKVGGIITDHSKAVVLLLFYVACFWCQSFGDVSPYVCTYYF